MKNNIKKHLVILGTRGIPAEHGGFETFAQYLSQYLIQKNWDVTVYCQVKGVEKPWVTYWDEIQLIHIPVKGDGALSTIIFDAKSMLHAIKSKTLLLTLGYNTALFSVLPRMKGVKNIMNMDGIEWRREKWSLIIRLWFYINEFLGCLLANHLVADHPDIKKHLLRNAQDKKITMIPYGAEKIESANESLLTKWELRSDNFVLLVARPEPENSILEVVTAYSSKKRNIPLVVLGKFEPDKNEYHNKVMNASSDEVLFLGAIYEHDIVCALRCFCRYYVHGHTAGGTNPSLVEALGAGCAVLAHNNKYNRWVAGKAAIYFKDVSDCATKFDVLCDNELVAEMRRYADKRFEEAFTWEKVLSEYEELLNEWVH